MKIAIITTMVEAINSFLAGQVIFFNSNRTSLKYSLTLPKFIVIVILVEMAGAAGIEPAVPVLETGGLPLTNAPTTDGSNL